jgi:hypothetical protein
MGLGILPDGNDQLRDAVAGRFLRGAGREGRPHQVRMHTLNTLTAAAACAAATNWMPEQRRWGSSVESARLDQTAAFLSELVAVLFPVPPSPPSRPPP